jgi:4-hydroxy-2-oxoheptanedioate aldolase
MRENKIRKVWEAGGVATNVFLSMPDSFSAEVMASLGFDGVTVDMQHGLVDYQGGGTMLQAISRYEAAPMVRVPWNDPAIIMKSLDAGAYGIICPMVNNRDDAERFVGACRYAPNGYRSTGPTRAVYYAGTDYHQNVEDTIITFAMIETKEALDNLDDILSTPGLDAIYIGPSDLSVSLGGSPGGDQTWPECMAAIEATLAGTKRHGIKAAIHTASAEYANLMIDKGFDLVTLSNDYRHMVATASEMLAATKTG